MKSKVCSNMFRIDSFELFKSVPNWNFRSLFKSSSLRIVCSNLFPIDIFELFKLFPIDNFELTLKIINCSKLFPIEFFMHVGRKKGKKSVPNCGLDGISLGNCKLGLFMLQDIFSRQLVYFTWWERFTVIGIRTRSIK